MACCALEICCDAASRRVRLTASIARFSGAEPEYCSKFLDWMDKEHLVFAPESFQATINEVVKMAKKHLASGV